MEEDKSLRNIWRDTKMIIPHYVFKTMRDKKIPFSKLCDLRKKWVTFRNTEIGDDYANDTTYLEYKGHFFSFLIIESKFLLWGENSINLGDYNIVEKDYPSYDFVRWLDDRLEKSIKGIYHCSDCKKEMKKNEIAGRYFAGIYCRDCWEREWKEREEQETYD